MIYLDGELAANIAPASLPTKGFHDNWFEQINEGLNALVRIVTTIDNELYSDDTFDCRTVEPPIIVDPPPSEPPPELPNTGLSLLEAALIGLFLASSGVALVAETRERELG